MDFTPMKEFMDRLTSWRIPGNSISICINNEEVFDYQSGYDDYENKISMRKDRLFNIYSCTKIATVTAALQLYEKGYFLLDDMLYDFIPQYRQMYVKDEDGNISRAKNHITLRHLFTMTSGLTYNRSTPAYDKARALTGGKMDTLTVAECIADDPLAFEPGERWLYSMSHDVLGAVIEVISGKKLRDYMRENIFIPLDMKETYFHNENVLDRVAQQYCYINSNQTDAVKLHSEADNSASGKLVREDKSVHSVLGCEYDSGGGGITTSVSDYSKLCSALANGGIGMNGEKIISSGTIDLMRTNQLNDKLLKDFNWKQLKGYGYGLGVRTLMDMSTSGNYGEFGWGGAAGATALVDPDLKLSMFYTHHMKNPHEEYYQPRLRNVLYKCVKG